MKVSLILICISLLCISCTDYDSEKYIQTENQAIQDIMLELIDFDFMSKGRNTNSQKLNLYLSATLDTITATIYEPSGYTTAINGTSLPEKDIIEGKNIYKEDLKKYRKEKQLFKPFKKGRIKKRKLHHIFEYPNLEVKLVTDIDRKPLDIQEMGYLYISRVVFNNSYNKGYLSYFYFCGEACFWNNNIEIIKVNGTWKVSKEFSGGIAYNTKYELFNHHQQYTFVKKLHKIFTKV